MALFAQVSTGQAEALGWSSDGRIIAFAAYHPGVEGDSGSLTLIIQNLYNDSIYYEDSRTWDSGYDYRTGESHGERVPYTLSEALSTYNRENPAFNRAINRNNIILSKSGYTPFPLHIYGITLEISDSESAYNQEENSYPLVMESEQLGKKTIADLVSNSHFQQGAFLRIMGYLMNPQKNRIAVIMEWDYGATKVGYSLAGSHLTAGFVSEASAPPVEQGTAIKAHFQNCLDRTPLSSVRERYRESVSPESQSKNGEGYIAYSEGDYSKAERLWEEALSLDGNNHFAHYNLACVKSLLTAQDGGVRKEEILYHLEKAWNGEIYWFYKSLFDSDLEGQRQLLLDEECDYYSPGDFGFDVHYEYLADGTFSITRTPTSTNFRGDYGNSELDESNEYMPMPDMEESASSRGYYFRICNKTVLYYPSGYWEFQNL